MVQFLKVPVNSNQNIFKRGKPLLPVLKILVYRGRGSNPRPPAHKAVGRETDSQTDRQRKRERKRARARERKRDTEGACNQYFTFAHNVFEGFLFHIFSNDRVVKGFNILP